MSDTSKNTVILPLADSGKAADSVPIRALKHDNAWLLRLLPVVVALCLGLIVGAMLYPRMRSLLELADLDSSPPSVDATKAAAQENQHKAENAPLDVVKLHDVVALGRLLPNGGMLAVAPPNGAGDARVARLLVEEGERVDAGQVIAELDNLPQLLAMQASAEFTLAAQQATLEQVRAATLTSLAEARANRVVAAAALVLANKNLARFTTLAERKLTTQELLQQAQSTAIKAAADLDRTAALVARFSGAETGNQADIVLATRNLDLARANLARANADLASARVVAPHAGTVLEIKARIGEKPAAAGVMTIGDIEQMTAELEVYQSDIQQVALGQEVRLTAQALSAPLTGKITIIGQIVGRQSVMSSEPAANADARVIKVTVALNAESSTRARAYSNLEVVCGIRTQTE
jgi:HlyD family secretion protein